MSPKIIHFDIRPGRGADIDLARMFPMTQVHTVRHMSVLFFIDDMRRKRVTPDFSISKRIELVRFRTIPTLDLALTELIDPAPWQKKILKLAPRPHTINLVPPLDIPYDALDARRLEKTTPFRFHRDTLREENIYRKPTKTYPDLYTRRLPYSLMMRRTTKEARRWTKEHRRGIAGVFFTLLVTLVPVIFFIKYSVENGYEKILSLRDISSPVQLRETIQSARDDFERANFLFFPFSWIPSDTIDLADRAIDGGRFLTRGLTNILYTLPTSTGTVFSFARSDTLAPEFRPVSKDIFPLESIGIETPTDWIDKNSSIIDSAFADISRAGSIYENISTESVLSKKMHDVGILLSRGMKYFTYAMQHKNELLQFLGHDEPIRYLVFNQNRDEIRANGGFPGSVIVFTFYKGNILDLRRDDVYYYDWNLYPYKEPPPPGLALLTENYGLRDVNYYPDFRITIEKANRFIERSGDSTITSAVAIHQGMIEEILKLTGPISLSGVSIPFEDSNFSLLMSTLVENQFSREYHPKDILFRFGDVLFSKIHEKKLYGSILDLFEKYWKDGEILFASRDEGMDATISEFRKKLPWECDIVESQVGGENHMSISSEQSPSYTRPSTSSLMCSPNWIYPIFTSVSGNKSDRYITRKYQSKTNKIQNCTYENIVTLSHTHTYKKSNTDIVRSYMDTLGITDPKEREKLEFIEGNGKNRAFTRLYVPKSATLAFSGADISVSENEDAKVFAFMLETNPGNTTSKTIRYTVDIPNCESVDTNVEWTRQPGIRELIIESDEK